MKTWILSAFLLPILFVSQVSALYQPQQQPFPIGPDHRMTPGSVCTRPTEYRYPERIKYCRRDVETRLKREIIRLYDQNFGYQVGRMNRQDFKIDHYIPLCMGGSNDPDNLWPQHKSVFVHTDMLEQVMCEKMAAGRLLQAQAIHLIREAKNNLSQAQQILIYVSRL